jgi:hypothetical protein
MKHLIVLLTLVSFLAGCTETEVTEQTQEEPETEIAPTTKDATAASSQPIIEYVYHKKGPDFSEESLSKAVVKWNSLIDESEYQMQFANILIADQPDENMDFMWAMLWESKDARDAGWNYWRENQASRWSEMTSGLLTYSEDYAYTFAPAVQRDPTIESDSRTFEARYDFCSFNDGHSNADLESFQNEYHAWLEAYETDNGPTGYWYVDLKPQFEPESKPDFVWLHLWRNETEMTTGMTAFEQSPLAERVTAMTSCQNYTFTGQRIRG